MPGGPCWCVWVQVCVRGPEWVQCPTVSVTPGSAAAPSPTSGLYLPAQPTSLLPQQ